MLKKLPIGIQTFTKMRQHNRLYVDKTRFVYEMIGKDKEYFFLSRPRRFGKSLLLDTIKQAFLGNKHLFEGLYLYDKWDWSQTYPVIHIDFGKNEKSYEIDTLKEKIHTLLTQNATHYDLPLRGRLYSDQFDNLIQDLHDKTGQPVVILIDEYDKPLLDAITDTKIAEDIRDVLRGFYSCMKSNDAMIKFAFVTGVTKFSKVSLFSGANHLEDITLDATYADCCGYTQRELETQFKDYLIGVDMPKLKHWYNGYNFGGSLDQNVYNPFDILLFFSKGKCFHPYWFETGTPTFLMKLLVTNQYDLPQFDQLVLSDSALSQFELDRIELPILMFQSGYLTILDTFTEPTIRYKIGFPNFEVRQGFFEHVLFAIISTTKTSSIRESLWQLLTQPSLDSLRLKDVLSVFFASIPHDWYRKNPMGQYEGFYASIIYTLFSALGVITHPEDTTSSGQMDMSILLPDKVIILEFKLIKDTASLKETLNPALEQINLNNIT